MRSPDFQSPQVCPLCPLVPPFPRGASQGRGVLPGSRTPQLNDRGRGPQGKQRSQAPGCWGVLAEMGKGTGGAMQGVGGYRDGPPGLDRTGALGGRRAGNPGWAQLSKGPRCPRGADGVTEAQRGQRLLQGGQGPCGRGTQTFSHTSGDPPSQAGPHTAAASQPPDPGTPAPQLLTAKPGRQPPRGKRTKARR